MSDKNKSLLALILLVPAPSLGVVAGMILGRGTTWGRLFFSLMKLWLLILPVVWFAAVEKNKLRMPKKVPLRILAFGAATGVVLSGIILAGYLVIGRVMIDAERFRGLLAEIGLADVRVYIAASLYWIIINSLLEEYVWRWFVVNQCCRLCPLWPAVLLSAAMFTLHHIIAMQVFFSWALVAIAGAGIFVAAAVWSWFYARYRSIWPGYVSHLIVDAVLFGIGYGLLFC